MKSYKLLHQLLEIIEAFEQENHDAELSIESFTGLLISRSARHAGDEVVTDARFGKNGSYAQIEAYQIDNNIGRLFIYMSRYAKSYIRKALEGTPLQTGEDFTALAILLTHESLLKTELINYNLQEKTSGMEVIRRLITAGLVTQRNDDTDKRGKRIAITATGRRLVYQLFVEIGYVSKTITGNLTPEEKTSLQYLLQKLELFHYGIHQQRAITTKDDIKTQAALLSVTPGEI